MVNPIRRMIRGIEDFIKRDKDFDVSVETNDEIYHLSAAIRSLCSRVSPAKANK
jgi:hypothetical protein